MGIAAEVTFGGSDLDRAAELRRDPAALERAQAQVLLFWRGQLLVQEGGALALLGTDHPALAEAPGGERLFLGRQGGTHYFARDISDWEPDDAELPQHPAFPAGSRLSDLRQVMHGLSPLEAELAATAKGLFAWHETHPFCARCGHASDMIEEGWQRRCPSCGGRHFPRTDPVVIMLITRGDEVLLGRSPGWPEGMFSMPAGFVEPGETIEAAVRREVLEETAVEVGQVDYLMCQPWPFPNSLMFACRGTALSHKITLDPLELEAALWLPRAGLARVMAGEHATIRAPRPGSVAEFVLRNWLADRLG
ncbi:NAD(+) diphosphatase [Pseudooceanicola sp. CBS1P-1]|uniref:NAD(+) diphosphatase n=1 Tax=Pseudooceanicola albus TaxID=2692189 RepID=A0A6L7GA90_9RHOB|nr:MULTISPECIES: NAD(+) diphosphatase [Pseudooceanicola]MBT9386394.1 NAD(+) diphosphatase [Pseudooceanicola endophyticus]MXN20448.1 NAD(+) diphosphatase [Pseudooceanicola albus]